MEGPRRKTLPGGGWVKKEQGEAEHPGDCIPQRPVLMQHLISGAIMSCAASNKPAYFNSRSVLAGCVLYSWELETIGLLKF